MERGRRDLGLERQWRERMSHWQASGLSVREFCQRRGLTEPTFHYWRRELRMRDAAASTAAMSSSSGNKSRPVFVPLTVLPAATLAVEVRCPSGHVVLLPSCDATCLASLFAALDPQARGTQSC
jgi:transposase-like protein